MEEIFSGAIGAVITGIFTVFLFYLEKKNSERKKQIDLTKKTIEDIVKPVLTDLQLQLNATRVWYLELKNGEYTASGHSLKSLRMIEESNSEDVEPCIDDFKSLPLSVFKRNIDSLRYTNDIIISKEYTKKDKESKIYKLYDIKNIIMSKVYTKNNKWTGILILGFNDENINITEDDMTWISMRSKYLGSLLK